MTQRLDFWVDVSTKDEKQKDTRPLVEKFDPLALSWAAYHVWEKFPHRRWVPWNDLEAHEHDKQMADETRRYYRNKLAMRALKSNSEPTPFSRDLYEICNGGVMRECHRGMLYRLPYFYVEDFKRATLMDKTMRQPDVDKIPRQRTEKTSRKLVKHDKIFHSRRSREIMEYWFHDVDTGDAVQWSVAYDNPLRSLVDYHWETHDTCDIYARWCLGHDRAQEFKYWIMDQPELRS